MLRTPRNAAITRIKPSSPDLVILQPCYVPKVAKVFVSLFFFYRGPVCYSLSALLQKLICNLFVLD